MLAFYLLSILGTHNIAVTILTQVGNCDEECLLHCVLLGILKVASFIFEMNCLEAGAGGPGKDAF